MIDQYTKKYRQAEQKSKSESKFGLERKRPHPKDKEKRKKRQAGKMPTKRKPGVLEDSCPGFMSKKTRIS